MCFGPMLFAAGRLACALTSALAYDIHALLTRTASALMGALQFLNGGVAMAVMDIFVAGSARRILAGIAGALRVLFVAVHCIGPARTDHALVPAAERT